MYVPSDSVYLVNVYLSDSSYTEKHALMGNHNFALYLVLEIQ